VYCQGLRVKTWCISSLCNAIASLIDCCSAIDLSSACLARDASAPFLTCSIFGFASISLSVILWVARLFPCA